MNVRPMTLLWLGLLAPLSGRRLPSTCVVPKL